jgi:hypothetical protein
MNSGIYTFTFAYGVSFGPIGWVLPSEVFPLSMRARGVALATASNWVNNCKFSWDSKWHVDIAHSPWSHSLHRPDHTRHDRSVRSVRLGIIIVLFLLANLI